MTHPPRRGLAVPLFHRLAGPSRGRERLPPAAIGLGLAGTLPFLAAAIGAWHPELPGLGLFSPSVAIAYGAVILSFLGGTVWGLAAAAAANDPLFVEEGRLFALSVVPSLIAWGALLLAPFPALSLLAAAFLAQLFVDRWMGRLQMVPPWWWRLRVGLTLVVVVCLFAIAMGFV